MKYKIEFNINANHPNTIKLIEELNKIILEIEQL